MNLTMILIVFMIFYMIYSNAGMGKRANKSKRLNKVLENMPDKEQIFHDLDELTAQETDPAFIVKYHIIKLWAAIYHNDNDLFLELLDELDIEPLISDGKHNTIESYEDSFFYLFLAIPNRLYYAKEFELLEKFYEKTDPYEDTFSSYMFYGLGKAARKFYTETGDLGRSMYDKLDEGDYAEYKYNKQLIGIYKNIASSFLAGIAQKENNTELFEEQLPYLRSFSASNLGTRWMMEIGLELPEEEEEDFDDDFSEEDEEESESEEAEETSESEEEEKK